MSELARFKLKLSFSGRQIDRHGLDFYDGATSLLGFSQALQIIVNSYMTGEVYSKATSIKGAQLFVGPPRRGSVIFDVITVIEKYPATAGISAVVFYDFVKFALARAAGYLKSKPETNSVSKLNDDVFFDRLAEVLEGSLQRGHRAIDQGVTRITLERPRSELLTFNKSTSEWVNTRDENPDVEELLGTVTRYNSITGNGRARINGLDRVIPFRLSDTFRDDKRGFLTVSLHGNTVHARQQLRFWASRIESARGDPKRLILEDCALDI